MNEIERAISEIIGTNYGECQCHRETMVQAVEALREKQTRESGCEWCKKGLRFECYLIDDDGHIANIKDNIVQTVIADYCPMCGKRLEVEHEK